MARALPVFQPFQLDDIQVASPCDMKWEDMTGGDRVRHCAACQKNVFNLSAMKRSEALALIEATEGKVCARFYRRKDGTILTSDCPVGVALVARRARRLALGAIATSLGAVATLVAFFAQVPFARSTEPQPLETGPTATFTRAVIEVKRKLEERKNELVVPELAPELGDSSIAGGIRPLTAEELKAIERATRDKPSAPDHD